MEIEFDASKDAINQARRGVSLGFAVRVLADPGLITFVDDRFNYGEERLVSLGKVDDRIFVVIYTLRGPVIRVISLRKANVRERRQYDQAQDQG